LPKVVNIGDVISQTKAKSPLTIVQWLIYMKIWVKFLLENGIKINVKGLFWYDAIIYGS
jgi:hypothetical protein